RRAWSSAASSTSPSTSSSKRLPCRTATKPSSPSRGSAPATALPCGSRISGLGMTSTTMRPLVTPARGFRAAVESTRVPGSDPVLRSQWTGPHVQAAASHRVEVVVDGPVGLHEGGLGVPHAEVLAVLPDHRGDLAQVGPGHRREQVVLHLEVEPAHEGVHGAPAGDVAAHEDLAAQEVDLDVRRHDRHADVVGREGQAHVQAEDRELHADEGERLARGQDEEDEGEEADEPDEDEAELHPAALEALAAHRALDAVDVEVDALEQEQRVEEEALLGGEPLREARLALLDRVLAEREHARVDVRVLVERVRGGVVLGVLALPP